MFYIPYDPKTDPNQYLSQALQQGVSGYLGHRQRQQFQKGLSPTLAPMQLLQKAIQSGIPMREAIGMARLAPTQQPFTLGPGQTRFNSQGTAIAKGVSKTEKLRYKTKAGRTRIWRGPAEELPGAVDQIINAGGTIDTRKSTLTDERLKEYKKAKAAGDTETAREMLLGRPLVEIQGQRAGGLVAGPGKAGTPTSLGWGTLDPNEQQTCPAS